MPSSPYEKQLLGMLLEECSLREMVNACAALLGSPIRFIFHQQSNGYIASDDFPPELAIREQQNVSRHLSDGTEDITHLVGKALELHGAGPFIMEQQSNFISYRRLICVAGTGGRMVGFVSLPELDTPLEKIDRNLISLCARCLALCLHQRQWHWANEHSQRAMHLLLTVPNITYQGLAHEAGSRLPPEQGRYRLLLLRRAAPNDTLSVLASQAALAAKTDWLHLEADSAAILIEDSAVPQAFQEQLPGLLGLSGCAACLSPLYTRLMQTGLWAGRMGRLPAFSSASPGQLILYEDYLVWGLIGESKLGSDELEDFIPAALRLLRDYDRTHGTALIPTLKAYCDSQCSKQKAAVRMGTHVNTVNYRLQKAEEVSGLSLTDPGFLFYIIPALQLLEYQQAIRLSQPDQNE